jgi:nitronate monooxygenase
LLLERLSHPIIQAPMAGGPSTPALALAVSEAGGLGFVAAGYRTPAALRDDIAELRAGTSAPFGVNVFVPGGGEADASALRAYVESLGPEAGEPRSDDDAWEAKLELLLAEPVAVVSFTFGCPAPELLASLREAGSEAWVTVTRPAEARAAAAAGASGLVLQGTEAGGHSATFDDAAGGEPFSTLALTRLVAAEDLGLPLVSAGGIADGAGIAAVLAAGADAAQLGTAFMLCPEAGTNPAHREALASDRPTALTRAFSGRLARGIENRFMREHRDAPSAYPQIHHATSPMRAAARERGDADGFNLWAGQTHAIARAMGAGELVRVLAADAGAALERASAQLTARGSG